MKKPKIIRCPYCGGTAILRDASFVYGTHSHGGQVYVCSHYPSCNSYVGVHPGTKIPKGTLANRELRQKRIQAHRIFDQIWQQGILSKPEAYRWVADKFCLTDVPEIFSDMKNSPINCRNFRRHPFRQNLSLPNCVKQRRRLNLFTCFLF